MANAVVIFDVSANEYENVVAEMRKVGYFSWWSSDNISYLLPHNTVWKKDTEFDAAITDLKNSITRINLTRGANKIQLIRYLVLNSTPWKATPTTETPVM